MQNAGQHFGQGGAHQSAPFGHSESTTNGGSITSSLRQFRRKNEDKQHLNDTPTSVAESHVARVPPHNHYPARQTADCYRYPQQYQDYNSPPVKFPEVVDQNQPLREHVSPSSVIQKTKDKEYMEMCNNVQQPPHMKQTYDHHHLNGQQTYPDAGIHQHAPPPPHAQYIHKEAQVHPAYKPESQYFPPKEHQYHQQLPPPHQMQKYNAAAPAQMRKFPPANDFLSKLRLINPTMARSIMSDHHLLEAQAPYQPMDQSRMYPSAAQNQRYMNYPSMPNNHYPPGYMSSQPYPNYPTSCSYSRSPQMGPRFPSINSHERSISPRRNYPDNMGMPMNYGMMPPQKVSPNYPHYAPPEYAQHYQHRRAPPMGQEYYQQQCRPAQYLPHQMAPQDMSESRVTVSDSIKQYIENWADEESGSELESSRLCKDGIRARDDQTDTIYMITASELHLENGIPLVTSENTIPMVTSENGHYVIKSGVSIDNSSGMVRIVDKNDHIMDLGDTGGDRVVNLHIMDPLKQDCMLANKPNDSNQRQPTENMYVMAEKPRVVIHQNTVIQSGYQNIPRDNTFDDGPAEQVKVGSSLPIITDTLEEELDKSLKQCRKVTVDKNCSPITLDQLEEYKEASLQSSVICSNKSLEDELVKEIDNIQDCNGSDSPIKDMQFFDTFGENDSAEVANESHVDFKSEESHPQEEITEREVQAEATVPVEETSTNTMSSEEVSQAGIAENNGERIETSENSDTPFEDGNNSMHDERVQPSINESCSTADISEKEDAVDTVSEEEPMAKEPFENSTPEIDEIIGKISDESVTVPPIDDEKHDEVETNEIKTDKENENLPQIFSTKAIEVDFEKPKNKRTRRIFSVDDIINNIGKNFQSRSENDILVRRHSIQSTEEFLDKEIANIFIFPEFGDQIKSGEMAMEILQEQSSKENHNILNEFEEVRESLSVTETLAICPIDASEQENQDTVPEKMITEEIIEQSDDNSELVVSEKIPDEHDEGTKPDMNENISGIQEHIHNLSEQQIEVEGKKQILEDVGVDIVVEKTDILFNVEKIETKNEETLVETEETINSDLDTDQKSQEECQPSIETSVANEIEIEKTVDDKTEIVDKSKVTVDAASQTCDQIDHEVLVDDSVGQSVDPIQETSVHLIEQKKLSSGSDQNEIQYRSVIRVEESSVLLQIGGELVEVSVNSVNGKNVITVLPLSDTAILDLNDNYETVINTESSDPLQVDNIIMETNDDLSETVEFQAVEPEPEIVETTSEIIIGMDLSLEEEIKLDVAQPPTLFTKAAKKAYDCDLQIPSITTSEDVYDKSKAEVYSSNDKVSSSKEHSNRNKKSERVDSSRKLQKSKRSPEKNEKKPPFEALIRDRNRKKAKQQRVSEEDEFVPFKELIKARKLKKMKRQENKNIEVGTVDSTIKIDEIGKETKELRDVEVVKSVAEEKTSIEIEMSSKVPSKAVSNKDSLESKKDEAALELREKTENICGTVYENKRHEERPSEKSVVEYSDSSAQKASKSSGDNSSTSSARSKEDSTKEIKKIKLEDPRLKARSSDGSSKYPEGKKKLSLEEYNKRKRKLATTDQNELKTENLTNETKNSGCESSPNIPPVRTAPKKVHFQRPKSLDDLHSLKPKENKCLKRKLSLQSSPVKQNYFDWEETQSPKTNSQNSHDKRFSEFSGLIESNSKDKSKVVIDVSRSNAKDTPADEILKNYKEQVDFKLSSLKFEIPPRVGKSIERPPDDNPFSDSDGIMERFLKNEKLTSAEMEKIRKIISYKRLVRELGKGKVPESAISKLNHTYEIQKESGDRTKLHLKKVSEKKRKNRFRNLYSQLDTDSDDDVVGDNKKSDYSVVQSNCLAGVVPKLIIKRKTEMPLPVVRLERLDLGLLDTKRIRYVV